HPYFRRHDGHSRQHIRVAIIQNPDRRTENPNCLVRGESIRIFDHDLAFGPSCCCQSQLRAFSPRLPTATWVLRAATPRCRNATCRVLTAMPRCLAATCRVLTVTPRCRTATCRVLTVTPRCRTAT